MLAPHHGSRQSHSPELAAWCRPEWIVVSGSRSTSPGDPTKAKIPFACRIVHTAEVGAIRVRIEKSRLDVRGVLEEGSALKHP